MLQSGWSIRHGFVDEFKIPVFGHAVGQKLGGFVVVEAIDIADGFAVVIADINNPNRNFFSLVVNIRLRAVQENTAPLRADGFGGGGHLVLRLRISHSDCGEI